MVPASRSTEADFVRDAEEELLRLYVTAGRADWVRMTYINDDTDALSADANARLDAAYARLAKAASRLPAAGLTADERRKVDLLRTSRPVAAPEDPVAGAELAGLVPAMEGIYSRWQHTPIGGSSPVDLQALSRILLESRDPGQLEDAWVGWHVVGREIRAPYVRFVELANRGARELGFSDTGAMWRSSYDMPPDDFAREVERLWQQVRPLYRSLHTFVRSRLQDRYGPTLVPEDGPIPAQLLGNMWAQTWEGIYPLVAPAAVDRGYDLTRILADRKTSPTDMVRFAERFFTSLGLDPLPPTFWQRSMFVRPRDREVVCHASAWDVDAVDDLRIKMCIEITDDDFTTLHHELGHNFYQRAYAKNSYLFRQSAHDGFHEAVGDTISLSVTPAYLERIGLLGHSPPPDRDIGILLYRALEKIAFLPFGLIVDRWRWDVFRGDTPPEKYNTAWWHLVEEYQGVAPPRPRGEEEFDPGAKYHVPANVPYMRYFLAFILQFQLHRALARIAGQSGPIHRASIYGSKEAGDRLRQMLEMGCSRPWPEALQLATGETRMDAGALLEYFAPLQAWLDEQNARVA
jgi:peptidyl-dipeptidase A